MDNSLFFNGLIKNNRNCDLIEQLNLYSESNAIQVYLISTPLGELEDRYEYNDAAVLLVPKHKICFINFDKTQEEAFEE